MHLSLATVVLLPKLYTYVQTVVYIIASGVCACVGDVQLCVCQVTGHRYACVLSTCQGVCRYMYMVIHPFTGG